MRRRSATETTSCLLAWRTSMEGGVAVATVEPWSLDSRIPCTGHRPVYSPRAEGSATRV